MPIPSEQRTPEQTATVFSYWRTTVPKWRKTNEEIAALWKEYPEGTSQLVLAAQDEPRETHVLTRGDFLKPAKLVEPGVPAYLNPLPTGVRPGRLAFAEWMVDRNSPTTARALMNRFWQEYFGTGIVSTSEDLGTQADPPSHPELLDWLAVEFMDNGLGHEGDASPHPDVQRIPAVFERDTGVVRKGSVQSTDRTRAAIPRGGRDRAGILRSPRAGC